MILSNTGQILWFAPDRERTHDLKQVRHQGRPHLAVFHHRTGARNFYELLDDRYRRVTKIFAGNGHNVNGHELQLTPAGTAYVSAYARVRVAGVGRVTDFVVQEIDLATREVLFEWSALDHVPLRASYASRPSDGSSWDYFHGNSIDPPTRGRRTIILSARKTSAVYGIDRVTGRLRWILGGKQDQFGLERRPGARFCAQHDARRMPNGDVTIFDNGGRHLGDGRECPVHPARVLRFRLDTARKRARLVGAVPSHASSENGRGYFPGAVGSARFQSNGDWLVNWGTTGRITQMTRTGRVKFRVRLHDCTYRAVRADGWRGRPSGRPRILARRGRSGAVHVWASWNGATEIRRWRVLAGDDPTALTPVRGGFRFADLETRMRLRVASSHVAAQALDASGTVLGTSGTVQIGSAAQGSATGGG
jgi:hypothetical protein